MKRVIWLLVAVVGVLGTSLPPMPVSPVDNRHPGCFCRDCAGGEKCCCTRAKSGAEKAVALSQCDRAQQQVAAIFSATRWMASEAITIAVPLCVFVGYHPIVISSLSRSVVPRDPPPRLL
jgi:hypothetical protein